MKYKFLILGAGPSGLTFANCLSRSGENNFLVLENEKEAGGLCKSAVVDKFPIDVGGGHFLDAENEKACDFAFSFMSKNEWNEYHRISKIDLNGQIINHPIESNIWQLNEKEQVEYLKSIALAGCNLNVEMPKKFIDWIYWKLGDKIAKDYMIPYNTKMFGDNLDDLGTYWLEKLPNVSFEDTLLSCINRKSYGKEPGHTKFYYPKKYGYGELWNRMADSLNNRILYNKKITSLNVIDKTVTTLERDIFQFEYLITTVPYSSIEIVGLPNDIINSISELKHSSVVIEYNSFDITKDIDNSHWIYYPSLDKSYHRILLRKNFLQGSIGIWTETNKDRFDFNTKQFYYINEYAYPLNTISKPHIMSELLKYLKKYNIYGLGRWGEHQHYNSDMVVVLAIDLAKKFV